MRLLLLALALSVLSLPTFAQSEASKKNVASPDREASDVQMDKIRKPAHLLDFIDLKPGMKVVDMGAGNGYTTELIARAVGPKGKVYCQNPPSWAGFVDKPLKARLKKDSWQNVERADLPWQTPFPEGTKDLDRVVSVLIYHDICNSPTDRAAMNKNLYDALKPGGTYIVVDHHTLAGKGTSETNTIHRIEERVVREEITAAGFTFVEEASFLAHPEDARDFMAFARPVQPLTDRFVLKFVKKK